MARRQNTTATSALGDRAQSCPNKEIAVPLFQWYQDAAQRNQKLQFVYRKALVSLVEASEKIGRAKDLEKLNGIGPRLRSKLEGIVDPNYWEAAPVVDDQSNASTSAKRSRTTSGRPHTREYIPAFRSTPYALLIALYIHLTDGGNGKRVEEGGGLCKEDLAIAAQPFASTDLSNSSSYHFTAPLPSALKTLTDKGLLWKNPNSRPSRYILTPAGITLAERLWNTGERRASQAERHYSLNLCDEETPVNYLDKDTNTMTPGPISINVLLSDQYEIILLVDTREVKSAEERSFFIERLQAAGIRCEQRNLELGDFLWIARIKGNNDQVYEDLEEVVLDCIIERKVESDLVASIIDGRFHEQKSRLTASGISRLIYLLERGTASGNSLGIRPTETGPAASFGTDRVEAALMQTQVIDGFYLRRTASATDTIRFLHSLHLQLCAQYHGQNLLYVQMDQPFCRQSYLEAVQSTRNSLQTYGCFAQLCHKTSNLTVRDVYLRQLMCISHLTAEKAVILADRYPTMRLLYKALQSTGIDVVGKQFGSSLSKRIHSVFLNKNI